MFLLVKMERKREKEGEKGKRRMKEGSGRDCLLVNMERDETEKGRKTKRRK